MTAYEILVLPVYYFLGTYSLNSAARLRAAMAAYLVGAVAVALVQFRTPGQHGGLPSTLAIVPLLAVFGVTEADDGWL